MKFFIVLPPFPALGPAAGGLFFNLVCYFLLCAVGSDLLARVIPTINAGNLTYDLMVWGFSSALILAFSAGRLWPISFAWFCYDILGTIYNGLTQFLNQDLGINLWGFETQAWWIIAVGLPAFATVWNHRRDIPA